MPLQPIGGRQQGGGGPRPGAGVQPVQRQVDLGALLARGPTITQPVGGAGMGKAALGQGIGEGLRDVGESFRRKREQKQAQDDALDRLAKQNQYEKELQVRQWQHEALVAKAAKETRAGEERKAATIKLAEDLRNLPGGLDSPKGRALQAQVKAMAEELSQQEMQAIATYESRVLAPWIDEIDRMTGSETPSLVASPGYQKSANQPKMAPDRAVLPDGRQVADPEVFEDGVNLMTIVDTLLQVGKLEKQIQADSREFTRQMATVGMMFDQSNAQAEAMEKVLGIGDPEAIQDFVDKLYANLELPLSVDELIGKTVYEWSPQSAAIIDHVNKLVKSGDLQEEAAGLLPDPALIAGHNFYGEVLSHLAAQVNQERTGVVSTEDEESDRVGARGLRRLDDAKLERVRQVMTAMRDYHGLTGLTDVNARFRSSKMFSEVLGPKYQTWATERRGETGEWPSMDEAMTYLAKEASVLPGIEELRAALSGEIEMPSDILEYRAPVFHDLLKTYMGEDQKKTRTINMGGHMGGSIGSLGLQAPSPQKSKSAGTPFGMPPQAERETGGDVRRLRPEEISRYAAELGIMPSSGLRQPDEEDK